jgi:hypothetical protein
MPAGGGEVERRAERRPACTRSPAPRFLFAGPLQQGVAAERDAGGEKRPLGKARRRRRIQSISAESPEW